MAVVGAGGRLGRAFCDALAGRATVFPLSRRELDLASPGAIRKILGGLDFDHLVMTAALTAVDHCEDEPEEAHQLNAGAPGLIAGICEAKGARMVHFSTDFVFDGGKEGAYSEQDEPSPISVYGASKLAGEQRVLAASPRHLVVRTSWVYGPHRPAFPEWIVAQAVAKDSLSLPAEKLGAPTYTVDLVDMTLRLMFPASGEPAGGLFHLCNDGSCSWREWGQACLDLAAAAGVPLKAREIQPGALGDIAAFKARRPVNSVMSTARYTRLAGQPPRAWREALADHVSRSEAILALREPALP